MQKAIFTFLILQFIVHLGFGQWTSQESGTNQDFWAISMSDNQVGYAGGGPWQFTSSCVISKTEDGGQTWTAQNPVSFVSCIFGVDALNPDTVYAVGCNANYYYGLILRSFNGGQTWTTKNISNTYGFYCVEFPTATIGYTCGWNGRIYKTVDAGDNWNSLPSVVLLIAAFEPSVPTITPVFSSKKCIPPMIKLPPKFLTKLHEFPLTVL